MKNINMKNPVRLVAYIVTFVIGMWGGSVLIKQLSNNFNEIFESNQY